VLLVPAATDLAAELSILEAVGRGASRSGRPVANRDAVSPHIGQRAPPGCALGAAGEPPQRDLSEQGERRDECDPVVARETAPGSHQLADHVIGKQAHLLAGRAAGAAQKM
jgi:hypothetical protein